VKARYDLRWGDPVVTRQALVETLPTNYGHDGLARGLCLEDLGYPDHLGRPELVEALKSLAERQSGRRPRHLVVTCGATGALCSALWALGRPGGDVVTGARYFPFYPQLIESVGMVRADAGGPGCSQSHVWLIDSPSNPEGLTFPGAVADVWDAAYGSAAYGGGPGLAPRWRAMCGSLSKTLGLPGLRLGWAATDEDGVALLIGRHAAASTLGLPLQAQATALGVLRALDMDAFEARAKGFLDDNRAEAQRLLDRFGQGPCPVRGMFFLVRLGRAEKRALERAGVEWQCGSTWGEDRSWARLSLGQDRELTRAAIRAALR
jgi:aspartate/methionine/tyrosine aminotransferase